MNLHRRQFLLTGLAARALMAQTASQPPIVNKGFAAVNKLADGVYATIADPSKGPQCLSNGGIVAGRDAVLLIEGHMQPAAAALEIEAARVISKAPIRAAINTHFHLDHTFGNLAYAEARIPILAHERVGTLMKERYAANKGVNHSDVVAPLEKRLAAASNPTDKQHLQSDLGAAKWMYDAIDSTTLAFPTESLAQGSLPTKIDLGGLTAVIEFHLGHTPTDLIVRIPERDIVFTGDLLFYRQYPISIDADMISWRKALDEFARYDRRTQFVPGHGSVCGLEAVHEQMDLLDDLRAHAEKMMRAGANADEAERRYTVPKRFENFPVFSWNWTIGAGLVSLYSGLKRA